MRYALLIFLVLRQAPAMAQEPVRRALLPSVGLNSTKVSSSQPVFDGWMLGIAASLVAQSQRDWGLSLWGPGVTLAQVGAGKVGFETTFSFIMPTGRYDFTGVSLDLDLAYGLPAGSSALLLLRLGATALAGGDSDGTGGGSAALYPGVGYLRRLSGPLALRLDVTPRLWVLETTALTFGASAGLVLEL